MCSKLSVIISSWKCKYWSVVWVSRDLVLTVTRLHVPSRVWMSGCFTFFSVGSARRGRCVAPSCWRPCLRAAEAPGQPARTAPIQPVFTLKFNVRRRVQGEGRGVVGTGRAAAGGCAMPGLPPPATQLPQQRLALRWQGCIAEPCPCAHPPKKGQCRLKKEKTSKF